LSKDFTESFQGKVIKVDRGGPESRIGKLLDESADYIAVLTEEDGLIYYNTHHIKSITENVKGNFNFDVEVPEDFEFKKAENFKVLLESLVPCWVKINRGGPETVEGVLYEVKNDFVHLVSKEEIVRIAMFHIKNVSYGLKIEKPESEEQESRQKSNGKSENNNNNTNSSAKESSQKSRQKSNDESKK
jgi:spore coat protein B